MADAVETERVDARERPGRPRRGRLCGLLLAPLAVCGGCFGYLMGWSDAEVDRQRSIIADLEVKNAELVETVLHLRTEIDELRRSGVTDSERKTKGTAWQD